jgi:glyoxylase-like metal-dependent hydrolase (beta-lactamase superfamily II)
MTMRSATEIADGVFHLRTMMVNVYLVRNHDSWALVDAGLGGYAETIARTAADITGATTAPDAIVLTHGHFDHVGSLEALLERWATPVFAHRLERPYLTGMASYPPPDPLVGRGSMALLSRLYPRGPIDISDCLNILPDGPAIPGMDEWRWVATPGHSPGHVSLFRDRDRTLLAGDAVTTTQQESALAVATQRREMHGPPAYFTQDWQSARDSVARLATLRPEVLATGHGEPLRGSEMRAELSRLASEFEAKEIPRFGRYAKEPAIANEHGTVRLPPDPLPKAVGMAAAGAVMLGIAYALERRPSRAPQRRLSQRG